jgi:uncharacterized protein
VSPFRNIAAESPWYDLFSRGARDWLRHNEKVRDAVKQSLPDLVSGPDALTNTQDRTVVVPVKLLEHARFRLAEADERSGVGQGKGEPGDVLRPGQDPGDGDEAGQGGNSQGEFQLAMEFKMDEIVDWLWEELKLPDLKPKQNPAISDDEWVREGWDKRGPRARLDRRRTMKEAIKRRAVQPAAAPFTNDDLRFRQITQKPKPSNHAVVIFALDVSGSMAETQRKLAKTFFFFALRGVRREYAQVDTVFLAHTDDAWEISEQDFFQARGSGGTVASSIFRLSLDIFKERFDANRYNRYLFYASDGENFREDRTPATTLLTELALQINYIGYAQTGMIGPGAAQTELAQIASELQRDGLPISYAYVSRHEDIWNAIRTLFQEQANAATAE